MLQELLSHEQSSGRIAEDAVRALAIAEGVAPLEGLTVDMAHVQVRCF
jgi:hypothetical protein